MLPFAGVFIALTAGLFPFFVAICRLIYCPNRGSFSLMTEKRLPYSVGFNAVSYFPHPVRFFSLPLCSDLLLARSPLPAPNIGSLYSLPLQEVLKLILP